MKTLQVCTPRKSVLDGTADFVVNLADLPQLSEGEAREFLDPNVLTSGMELLVQHRCGHLPGYPGFPSAGSAQLRSPHGTG